MKLSLLDRDGFRRLLFKLSGTGYSQDEDSIRYDELDAVALIATMAGESLSAAVQSVSYASVDAALDLYEQLLFFVQGQSLGGDARRARLVAFARALPRMTPARLSHAFGKFLGIQNGATLAPTLAQLKAHRTSPLGALLVARRENSATTATARRDLATILARGIPATSIPGAVSVADASWSGGALEPNSLRLAPSVTVPAQTKARVAPIEVHPGSVVTREQWLEIQAQLCWKSRGFSLNQAAQGRTLFVNAALSSGANVVDTTTNWANRIVQAWGAYAFGGSIADPATLPATNHVWLAPSKTGAAGSGYSHELLNGVPSGPATGITLSVNGSGNLVITAASARNVRIFVRCSPAYVPGSSADTQPWMDPAEATFANVAELYASTYVGRAGDAEGFFGARRAGAIRRVVYSGPLYCQGTENAGIPRAVVLDTSEDWRNRFVLVVPLTAFSQLRPSPPVFYPAASNIGMMPPGASSQQWAPRVFATGSGTAQLADTAQPYQMPVRDSDSELGDASIWIYANTQGHLCCEAKAGASRHSAATLLALVISTETANNTSVVQQVPVHATVSHPIDFEQPQNNGCFAQGRQGGVPRYELSDPAPKPRPTCPPLGVISDGHAPVRPVMWEVRERLGARDDATWERRQPIERQRKRLISIVVPAGAIVSVDDENDAARLQPGQVDQIDFRDRFIWAEGRYSTTDIRVSRSAQLSDASASAFQMMIYGGAADWIHDISSGSGLTLNYVYSRNFEGGGYHARLVLKNLTAAAVYVNMAIEVSGFLGCVDRRAYGPPIVV